MWRTASSFMALQEVGDVDTIPCVGQVLRCSPGSRYLILNPWMTKMRIGLRTHQTHQVIFPVPNRFPVAQRSGLHSHEIPGQTLTGPVTRGQQLHFQDVSRKTHSLIPTGWLPSHLARSGFATSGSDFQRTRKPLSSQQHRPFHNALHKHQK